MLHRYFLLFLLIGFSAALSSNAQTPLRHTLSGYVREKGSGELLPGVTVYIADLRSGTTTNKYGFYSITLPEADSMLVRFSFIGFATETARIGFAKSVVLNVEMGSEASTLREVVVNAARQKLESESVQMSSVSVPIGQIKDIPAFLGEKDVLKVLQLMPGVQKGSEGNAGLYVRGGGPDQNLIILDDAPVYNAFHLFGFFSLFNGDALKSVELIKGGFPARYGGRLSSVIEMQMKEGNKEKLHGEGGIGVISSRLLLEGPIQKGKSSFLVSGRRTYVDALIRPFLNAKDGIGGYYFYDFNAKLNYDFGQRDKVYLSGYFGKDDFSARQSDDVANTEFKAGLNWGNSSATLRWNHLFSEKVFSNTSLIFSNYRFKVAAKNRDADSEFDLQYLSGIRDFTFKTDFDFLPNPKHAIKAGLQVTAHRFTPSAVVLQDTDLAQFSSHSDPIDAVESGLYVEDTYRPIQPLQINAGFRLSQFTADHKTYLNPEPRLSVAYTLPHQWALKASYAKMNQYVHLLSNSGVGLPTDLWVPSTSQLRPQQSQQVALGIAKDLPDKDLTITVEGFYKKMNRIIAYKEGSGFLQLGTGSGISGVLDGSNVSRSWESIITTGQGWSYGAEFLIQRKIGRFTGWAGYTLSWIQQQFDELNFGRRFWARYDRRHDISLVGTYKISPKITLSATWIYGTGQAITLPMSTYRGTPQVPGQTIYPTYTAQTRPADAQQPAINTFVTNLGYNLKDYQERNSFRAAPYHRFDIGVRFHRQMRRHERTWEFSIYNVYNRHNPYFYLLSNATNATTGARESTLNQISLFPILPSLSYNFSF